MCKKGKWHSIGEMRAHYSPSSKCLTMISIFSTSMNSVQITSKYFIRLLFSFLEANKLNLPVWSPQKRTLIKQMKKFLRKYYSIIWIDN
jgi:hypothetical protein